MRNISDLQKLFPRGPIGVDLGVYLKEWLHMVITLSVMPPFTYPSLSLASHGAIMVIYSLLLFVCPSNDNVTRVSCLVGFRDRDL
jgi:hypothetical protein